jgi:hypothetical protein
MSSRQSKITFQVDKVSPARKPLPETNGREVLDNLLHKAHEGVIYHHNNAMDIQPTSNQALARLQARHVSRLETAPIPGKLVASSHDNSNLVSGITYHPVVAALKLAYAQHRPIALSPDMIWLLICLGVAQHINLNAEELRHKFVTHEGQHPLVVIYANPQMDDLSKLDWNGIVGSFASLVEGLASEKAAAFTADFSTTGTIERTASNIVLLGALQKYFHLMLIPIICGLPQIKLEGTASDWNKIIDRTDAFSDLGLDWWLAPLRSILARFPAAFKGDISPEFWRSIYRIYRPNEPCSLDSATGWISMFFPYLADGEGQINVMNPWLTGEKELGELLDPPDPSDRPYGTSDRLQHWFVDSTDLPSYDPFHGVYDSQLPTGISNAPFQLEMQNLMGDTLHTEEMDFLGGFVGVSQDPISLFLRPQIGWGIRRTEALDS